MVGIIGSGDVLGHGTAGSLASRAQGTSEVVALELSGDKSRVTFGFLASEFDHFM
jgi:hypothetical protein